MKKLLALCSFLYCMGLIGCGPPPEEYVIKTGPPPPAYPGYVYLYGNGDCYVDDVMYYGACPWQVGPNLGLYVWEGGTCRWWPGYVWPYMTAPPPHRWWANPPRPHYGTPIPPVRPHPHYAAPPRRR